MMKRPHLEWQSWLGDLWSGYGQVYFTNRRISAALFMVATFMVPAHGIAGLAGLLLANAAATVLGMPREYIRQGYFGYNGLLIGLALGLIYQVNLPMLAMLAIVSCLGVLIAAGVRSVFERYLAAPALSLPFVVTTWVALLAGERFSHLLFTLEPYRVTYLVGVFPHWVDFTVRSLAATFFQLSVPSGLLIALGLLVFSRYAFLLAICGLALGAWTHLGLGGNPAAIEGGWIGFNFALTAVAVGGIWMTPGVPSFLLAMLGAACCAVVAEASTAVLSPLELPLLAFPFVATTTAILPAMRLQERPGLAALIPAAGESPEATVKSRRATRDRALETDLPAFETPFSGAWTVTQGVSGEYTHQQAWAHAWDFEVMGKDGKSYANTGTANHDFFAYKLPVLAPADGTVVRVVDTIPDNPIGYVNGHANWGNVVVLWHYDSVYTAYAHLAPGEIAVQEGQQVRAGRILGRVGSSGRSPAPHLHFQVQQGPAIGAPTAAAELLHYVSCADGVCTYHTRGVPGRGEEVSPLVVDHARFEAASFPLGRSWTFRVRCNGRETIEQWDSHVDFQGRRSLVSRETRARLALYLDRKALVFLQYQGPRTSGLAWLFLAVPRLPFTSMPVRWTDRPQPDALLDRHEQMLAELVGPFGRLAGVETCSEFGRSLGPAFNVETTVRNTGPWLRDGRQVRVSTRFDQHCGLVGLQAFKDERVIFELDQIDQSFAQRGEVGPRTGETPVPAPGYENQAAYGAGDMAHHSAAGATYAPHVA